jgi:uncharacterized protein (DUF1697 family)
MRQIVLLRGINLPKRNRVSMPQLRDALAGAGFEGVSTYLQSGNAVLSSDARPDVLAGRVERLIASAFGLDIDVVVRTRDELAAVVEHNPLAAVASDPKRYQVSFLARDLDASVVAELAALAVGGEELRARGRELYAWYPTGVGRSRLALRLASARLPVVATSRNWATVTALLDLADG